MSNMYKIAVFGGGCFWCAEAAFLELKGVQSVTPGYAGGEKADPTYEEVCAGKTGHAEVIRVEFDPEVISYKILLTVFFAIHDPTTLNRQGNDVGAQYRSMILWADSDQKAEAESFIRKLDEGVSTGGKVLTEIKPLEVFYGAESYHREYYAKNLENKYCQIVINPKLAKLKADYAELLKKQAKTSLWSNLRREYS